MPAKLALKAGAGRTREGRQRRGEQKEKKLEQRLKALDIRTPLLFGTTQDNLVRQGFETLLSFIFVPPARAVQGKSSTGKVEIRCP